VSDDPEAADLPADDDPPSHRHHRHHHQHSKSQHQKHHRHHRRHRSFSVRNRRWILLLVAAVGVVVVVPAAIAGVLARRDLNRARNSLLAARTHLSALQPEAATADLNAAAPELSAATGWLTSVATLPGRLVPGISGNIEVAIALAHSGTDLVAAGRQSVQVLKDLGAQGGHVHSLWQGSTVNVALLAKAAGPAAAVQKEIQAAQKTVDASHGILLVPQVSKARTQALADLSLAAGDGQGLAAATALLPAALGADSPRTWLIGAGDNAELRGRAGYLGASAVVVATQGSIALSPFKGTETLPPLATAFTGPDVPVEYQDHYRALGGLDAWQNLTMSPSFADGAELLLSRMAASGVPAIGGAVDLDPTALSDIMKVTGPVQVAGIPVPLTARNIVYWSLNQIYTLDAASNSARKATLAQIAQAVWQKVISGGADPLTLARALGQAIHDGHLFVYSSDPKEQAAFSALGITGSVSQAPGDYLMVLSQNLGENKMDYYMQRQITYSGTLTAGGAMQSTVTVDLHNTAPAGAVLTGYVGGARPALGLGASVDRSYLSIFVPAKAVLAGITVNDVAVPQGDIDNGPELGRRYFATDLDTPPGATMTVVFSYRTPGVLAGGTYQLTLQNQAMVQPDHLSVHISLPAGASASASAGQGLSTGSAMSWQGEPPADKTLRAAVGGL
jgi:hypothetical protein